VNFQVTILKVLVSYPDGFASPEDVTRDAAILVTSGRDRSERTTRLAARLPGLEIFAHRSELLNVASRSSRPRRDKAAISISFQVRRMDCISEFACFEIHIGIIVSSALDWFYLD
jgi:hypothetical protein